MNYLDKIAKVHKNVNVKEPFRKFIRDISMEISMSKDQNALNSLSVTMRQAVSLGSSKWWEMSSYTKVHWGRSLVGHTQTSVKWQIKLYTSPKGISHNQCQSKLWQ